MADAKRDPSPSAGEGQRFEKVTGTKLRKLKVQSLKEELWRERLFLEENKLQGWEVRVHPEDKRSHTARERPMLSSLSKHRSHPHTCSPSSQPLRPSGRVHKVLPPVFLYLGVPRLFLPIQPCYLITFSDLNHHFLGQNLRLLHTAHNKAIL